VLLGASVKFMFVLVNRTNRLVSNPITISGINQVVCRTQGKQTIITYWIVGLFIGE
jgi:hypothetical protein